MILSILAMVMAGCSVEPVSGDLNGGQATVQSTPADFVKLYYAKIRTVYLNKQLQGQAKGFIEIAKVAYNKQVIVRYNVAGTSTWIDVPATYVKDHYNKEVWKFEINNIAFNQNAVGIRFAVKYTVNGQTYWDNNNGQDYRLSYSDATYEDLTDVVFGKSQLMINHGESYIYRDGAYPSVLFGWVRVRNVGAPKTLTLIYTTDGWNTTQTTPLFYYDNSPDGSIESWKFFTENVSSQTTQFDYAVSMTVNGYTTWDNNFQQNYQQYVPVPEIQSYLQW